MNIQESVDSNERDHLPYQLAHRVYLTPTHLLLFTAFSVFAGEVIVMLILAMLPPLSTAAEALADGFLLTLLATPFLYLFLFRPMAIHIAVRKAAEDALRGLNTQLEKRIEERTSDLAKANHSLEHEIENRMEAERELKKSHDFIVRVVESTPCVTLIFDVLSMGCTYVNSSVVDQLGYSPEEVQMKEFDFFKKVISEKDRAAFDQLLSKIAVGEANVVKDRVEMVTSEGKSHDFSIKLAVFSTTATGEPKELLLSAIGR